MNGDGGKRDVKGTGVSRGDTKNRWTLKMTRYRCPSPGMDHTSSFSLSSAAAFADPSGQEILSRNLTLNYGLSAVIGEELIINAHSSSEFHKILETNVMMHNSQSRLRPLFL